MPADSRAGHCVAGMPLSSEKLCLGANSILENESAVWEGISCVVANADSSGTGSLRWAIEQALDGGAVVFDQSLNGQTIVLAGELAITKSIAMDASALGNGMTVSGKGGCRILNITGKI